MPQLIFSLLLTLALLIPQPIDAAEYFIKPTGNDGLNGLSEANAWLTINKALGGTGISAGDTLTFLGGTYNIAWGESVQVPNGTGATGRTVIRAKPINRTCSGDNVAYPAESCWASTYETVILTGGASANDCRIRFHGAKQWIVIEGLILDGANGGADFGICVACDGSAPNNPPDCTNPSTLTCSSDLRFMNVTVRNFSNSSGFIGHAHQRVEVLHSKITRNGSLVTNKDHGMYWSGIDSKVAGNELWENGGTGAQHYRNPGLTCLPKGENMLVERNYYHHNGLCGTYIGGWNNGTTYRNNISANNGGCGVAVASYFTAPHKILNNTLPFNGNEGIRVFKGGDNAIIKNNIHSRLFIESGAENLVLQNNYNLCSTCAVPEWVDPLNGDFRLTAADTLALNLGQNLTSDGVTIDYYGVARPQGGAFDIGATEFLAGTTSFDYALTNNIIEEEEPVIIQGQSTDVVITATTLSGTAGPVVFAAAGLPSGATATFNPTSCTPTAPCTSTLTIQTANGTPEGGFDVQVRGVAAGLTRTTTVPIVVTCD